jgi:hypothetical protein
LSRSATKPYEYHPLSSERYIRLLELLPEEDESLPVKLAITSYELSKAPEYAALSYTWGKSSAKTNRLVGCGDSIVSITKNLFEALQHLRDPKESRFPIWIDAICINQEDATERASQVKMMGDIYKQAKHVLIWLGPSDINSRGAMPLLQNISKVSGEFKGDVRSMDQWIEAGILPANSTGWEWVEALVWRAWFTRVWVTQEVCLAESSYVICGRDSMPVRDFFTAVDFIITNAIQNAAGIYLGSTPFLARLHMAMTWKDRPRTLLGLLMDTRSYRATDPRDKIFALRGLCNTAEADLVMPDYETSVDTVFTSFAKECINQANSLDLLTAVCDPFWRGTRHLPSWVPDWITLPRTTELLRHSEPIQIRSSATENSRDSVSIAEFSPDGNVLIVQGTVLDTIGHTYRPFIFRSIGQRAKQLASTGKRTVLRRAGVNAFKAAGDGGLETVVAMAVRVLLWEVGVRRAQARAKTVVYSPTGESFMQAYLNCITGGALKVDAITVTTNEDGPAPESKTANGRHDKSLNSTSQKDESRNKAPNADARSRTSSPPIQPPDIETLYTSYQMINFIKPRTRVLTKTDLQNSEYFSRPFIRASWGRTFAVSKQTEYFCLAPFSTRLGDTIVLLKGGKTPYLLRKKRGKWSFVGECFVYGVMHGEKWDEKAELQKFEIL